VYRLSDADGFMLVAIPQVGRRKKVRGGLRERRQAEIPAALHAGAEPCRGAVAHDTEGHVEPPVRGHGDDTGVDTEGAE